MSSLWGYGLLPQDQYVLPRPDLTITAHPFSWYILIHPEKIRKSGDDLLPAFFPSIINSSRDNARKMSSMLPRKDALFYGVGYVLGRIVEADPYPEYQSASSALLPFHPFEIPL